MKKPKRGYEFQNVKAPKVPYSVFNLSHKRKTTIKMGELQPTFAHPVFPGDKFRLNLAEFTRAMPMVTPVMQNIDIYHHFFYVPWRIVWPDFDNFRTVTTEESLMEVPMFCFRGGSKASEFNFWLGNGSLADYLGLQTANIGGNLENINVEFQNDIYVNALPFFAWAKIWNEYYRDENLQEELPELNPLDFSTPLVIDMDGSPGDNVEGPSSGVFYDRIFMTAYRAFRKDYFTSALPWEQKGPDVTIPVGGEAPVNIPEEKLGLFGVQNLPEFPSSFHIPFSNIGSGNFQPASDGIRTALTTRDSDYGTIFGPKIPENLWGAKADLSSATSITINELRRLNQLQKWEELEARGGSRPIEQTLAHFGEYEDDLRLQRPQYLGGMKNPLTISEVLQTSATDDTAQNTTPLADMAGHGVSSGANHIFKQKFKEFGIIIGITSIIPDGNYMQGTHRMFLMRDRYDLPWPLFAHLGEQAIYQEELFNTGIPRSIESDSRVFGYAPRYSEYKYIPDTIHGELRGSMNNWHMGRIFKNSPFLNSQFISTQEFSSNLRNFAVNEEPPFVMQLSFDISAARHLPMWSTPRL